MKMKFKLGQELVDVVTGFTSVAVGFARYMTGCDQYILMPKSEGPTKYPEGQWLDDNRLKATKNINILELPTNVLVDNGACELAPKY